MGALAFVRRQVAHIRRGGRPVFARKAARALRLVLALPFWALAVPAVMLIRLVRPWILVRVGILDSRSLGHLAADVELYLCERDAGVNQPGRRHLDLFYMYESVCNRQLATMWKRLLPVWPNWILAPLHLVDQLLPGERIPDCGANTQGDRDVHNLLDRMPPHLVFTAEEEVRGKAGLREMGIPEGGRFVCLNVRDNAWNAHWMLCDPASHEDDEASFRDSNVQNYVLAAEALADRGYIVIRMGAVVRESMKTSHPGVIDYATNGMRSDFMDIYLGATCEFCISVGSGFDAVPLIFRRPIAFVNVVPLGDLVTYCANILGIAKRYRRAATNKELSLAEILDCGDLSLGSTSYYKASGIRLVENTPEEIRDLAVEMAERLQGTWRPQEGDDALQERFWEVFLRGAPPADGGVALHGEIRARFGASFLRDNPAWLAR